MKIIENIKIRTNSDIIYAKTILGNLLKNKENLDGSFLIFSLMELSTNLIKHATCGNILVLESSNQIFLCALDYGSGIKDVAWSLKNGTTRMENSLGLGLYQMSQNENYELEICTMTKNNMHGTVVLLRPKSLHQDVISLQIPHETEVVCGDIFARKGRFLLLADGCGHGKKANKSVELAKAHFYNRPFSCILVDEFFFGIDKELKEKQMRGMALSIFELSYNKIQVCGVGNISFWVQKAEGYEYVSQKEGILGEHYHTSDKLLFELSTNDKFIAATDGIDICNFNELLSYLNKECSNMLLTVSAMHFTSLPYDDKTIVVITTQRNNDE